jgi:hypothetical protein
MSRSPSLAPGGIYGYQEERERENRERRMTTPFYYATPHSEAIPEFGYQRASSRGPVPPAVGGNHGLRMGGYDDELGDAEYGDEEMDDFTTGSETGTGDDEEEAGDSEMTDHHHHHQPNQRGYYQSPHHLHHGGSSARRQIGTGSFGFGTDGDEADLDIDVYQDEDEDELDGVDTDAGNVTDNNNNHHKQQPLRPEDIPWAGIEDAIANGADAEGDSNMSDGENVDPTTSQSSQSHSHSSSFTSSHHSQLGQLGQVDEDDEAVHIAIHEDDHLLLDMDVLHAGGQGQGQGEGGERAGEGEDDEASSQAPSEYSSKPSAWQIIAPAVGVAGDGTGVGQKGVVGGGSVVVGGTAGGGVAQSAVMGFRIHEDGTAGPGVPAAGEELLDTQWE